MFSTERSLLLCLLLQLPYSGPSLQSKPGPACHASCLRRTHPTPTALPACNQILEEAGLAADQVQLVRSGRPLVVDDGEQGKAPGCAGH